MTELAIQPGKFASAERCAVVKAMVRNIGTGWGFPFGVATAVDGTQNDTIRLLLADALRDLSGNTGVDFGGLPSLVNRNFGPPRVVEDEVLSKILEFDPEPGALQVSFSHDAGMTLCIAIYSSHICGLGIDLLDRSRLQGRITDPARRSRFLDRIGNPTGDRLPSPYEAEAIFSLKEAASKAVGTGLRLGLGFGRRRGVPPLDIQIHLENPARVCLGGKAFQAALTLGGSHVEGQFHANEELLVSTALLLKSETRLSSPETDQHCTP